jgi:hypothetical protein
MRPHPFKNYLYNKISKILNTDYNILDIIISYEKREEEFLIGLEKGFFQDTKISKDLLHDSLFSKCKIDLSSCFIRYLIDKIRSNFITPTINIIYKEYKLCDNKIVKNFCYNINTDEKCSIFEQCIYNTRYDILTKSSMRKDYNRKKDYMLGRNSLRLFKRKILYATACACTVPLRKPEEVIAKDIEYFRKRCKQRNKDTTYNTLEITWTCDYESCVFKTLDPVIREKFPFIIQNNYPCLMVNFTLYASRSDLEATKPKYTVSHNLKIDNIGKSY